MVKSRFGRNEELKFWCFYFVTILFSNFLHEMGHCMVAWAHGFRAIPTPAKAYLLEDISPDLNSYFSLGGIISSVVFPLIIFSIFMTSSFKYNSALIAGAIAMPAMYTLRFLKEGRGHDASEFQQAQSALGLQYSGHFLDWLFVIILLIGVCLWAFRAKPNYKAAGRILLGVVLTFVFIVLLQKINNLIFDPIFQS